MQELDNCPFCGGEAVVEIGLHNFDDVEVRCSKCCAASPNMDEAPDEGEAARRENALQAIAAWNTRTSEAQLIELLKRSKMFVDGRNLDWGEDRVAMSAIHLSADIDAVLKEHDHGE